ncbi:MAD2 mitotic arrest deficient-like 2 [Modicella reniformis]|uniref:MAD2 mitotic arrest deficient-like 2 n=1 Tax=Modicella reniformis TaxID=1440133 RepID=A0A9P6J6G4_9FUNG|nr:MAD2 mitotic arrest deficient-like 2 [Modicella reniformis]
MADYGGRAVVSDVLSEFFEVAIHMILFVRGIYPPELFESTQKYGCPIKTARHPGLLSYIQQIVRSIRVELQKDSIHKICVVTLGPTGQAIERFVFEASVLRAFEDSILQAASSSSPRNNVPGGNHVDHRPHHHRGPIDKGKGRVTEDYSPNTHVGEAGQGHRSNQRSADLHDDIYRGDHGDEPADEENPLYRMTARERLDRLRQQRQRQQEIRPHYNSVAMREGPRFGGLMTLTTDVEWMLRAMLLKISICDSYLKPLTQEADCSFTVVVEMRSAGAGPDAKADFPWSPISPSVPSELTKLPATASHPSPNRKIIPVKTIDIADIQLELYIEQLC